MEQTPAQAGSRRESGQPGHAVPLARPPRAGEAASRGQALQPSCPGPRASQPARAKRSGQERILSVPNVLSTVRLALAPVLAWMLAEPARRYWFTAAVLLGVLGFTDGLDGQLARRLGQVTNLGKVLDTVADRVLLGVAVVGSLAVGALPLGVALAALLREGIVAAGALALALAGARRVDVVFLGKAGTFGLMCALPLFLAGRSPISWHHTATIAAWALAVPALAFAWASLVAYAPQARVALSSRQPRRRGPKPAPAPPEGPSKP